MKQRPKTLVLIRGLMRETRHWGDFPEQLKALNIPIALVDLPGVGSQKKVTPPTSIFGNAEFLRQEVLKNFEGPFGLVGVSLGGMVALEWMQNHPSEIAGTLVINTSCNLSSRGKRLRWQIWSDFVRLPFISDAKQREHIVTQLVVNHPDQQKKAYESWVNVARDFKTHSLAFAHQVLAAARYRPSENCKGSDRVLVISSDGDRLVDPSCGYLLAEKWGWAFKSHPWGGHDLAWDDPDWMKEQIRTFFT